MRRANCPWYFENHVIETESSTYQCDSGIGVVYQAFGLPWPVVGKARGFRGAGECGSESWRKAWREEEVGPFSYGHATGNGLKRSMISIEMRFLVGTGIFASLSHVLGNPRRSERTR